MQEKKLKISEIKGRFLQFIETQDVSVYKFSTETGISKSNFSGKSLESELGGGQISEILTYFPDLNPDWLLLGEGEMLRGDEPQMPSRPLQTIPLIPFEAIAGIPSIDNIGVSFASCEQYLVPEFASRGADFLIRVSGSSMYPKYSNGDLLACTVVRDILFFQWGKVYVIDSSQGVLVKRVFESEKEGCIRLVSDNSDRYPPFDFPTSDIRTLALVAGVIRLE